MTAPDLTDYRHVIPHERLNDLVDGLTGLSQGRWPETVTLGELCALMADHGLHVRAVESAPVPTHVVVLRRDGRTALALPYTDADEAAGVVEQLGADNVIEATMAPLASADVSFGLLGHAREADVAANAWAVAADRRQQAASRLSALVLDLTQYKATPAPPAAATDPLSPGTGPWDAAVPMPEITDPEARHSYGLGCGVASCVLCAPAVTTEAGRG